MDIRQSDRYARYLKSLGWKGEKAGNANVFIRRLPFFPFLSVIKIQRPTSLDFSALEGLRKKYHAVLTKIEPDRSSLLARSPFRPDNWPLLPTKTLILDLDKITLNKDIRYEIRKAGNLQVTESKDPERFYKMLQETMKIGHWSVPIKREVVNLWQSFQPDNSAILLTPVSGCLLIWEGDTAHYMYAANTAEGRKGGAAYLTLWETLQFCRKKKLKFLDLEGIYDERYPSSTKTWQGFTAFKKQWGGKVVEYPGSFTRRAF